jgi:hypothetical protein
MPQKIKKFNDMAMLIRIGGALIGISIFLGVWLACWPNQPVSVCNVTSLAVPTETELNHSIDLAAHYLLQNCDRKGRFVYLRHRDRYVYYGKKYNLLRHAGSMYSLAEYQKLRPSKELADLLVRTAGYLRRFIKPVPKAGSEARAILTYPGLLGMGPSGAKPFAKLGGSGLGLVALASVESLSPGTVPLEELRGLGHFIRFMQTPEGRFYSKYYPRQGYETKWVSLYYPGEACLGLLMLYDLDPDPRWLDAAVRGLGHLARTRKGVRNVPADHWALIATAKLLPKLNRLADPPVGRQELIDHATQILKVMLAQQKTKWRDPCIIGSFLNDARTTPTATRLEGLLAALRFLPENMSELRSRLEHACDIGIAFLVHHQIRDGALKGGIPRAAHTLRQSKKNEKFNKRVGEVRIDYVQHALSAMMEYQELLTSQSTLKSQANQTIN